MKSLLYIGNKLSRHGKTPTTIETLGPLLAAEGYKVTSTSSKLNKVLRGLDIIWQIYKLRKTTDYILIDTYSTANFYIALVSSQLARAFNISYIPILHGGDLPSRLEANPRLCADIFKNAKVNVAPSLYLESQFNAYGYTNVTCIPNPIHLKDYSFKSRGEIKPRLLWVRSFAEIYNPLLAVKVLLGVSRVFPDAKLCMVGPDKDGSMTTCKHFAEAHNLNVEFTGKLSRENWTTKAASYDIFLNTTNFDNTPVSVIEAMALGLPVISTSVGGMRYLIDDNVNGLLVPPNSEEAIVTAILNLIEHNDKAKVISENARQRLSKFDWKEVKKEWNSLLS